MSGEHERPQLPAEPPAAGGSQQLDAAAGAASAAAGLPDVAAPGAVDLLAAALRADAADLATYERVLFSTLTEGLPAGVVDIDRIRSMSDRMAGRPGRPSAIRIHLGDETLEIAEGRGGIVARIARDVRGVTISRRDVTIAEWSHRLAELLALVAAENAATRAALERFLGAS